MRRCRGRVRGELHRAGPPLVISGHRDWPQLSETILETRAGEVWGAHGREDAFAGYCRNARLEARAISLLGYREAETG